MPVSTEAEWESSQAAAAATPVVCRSHEQEMLPRFRRNVIERIDELLWKPESPFRYCMDGENSSTDAALRPYMRVFIGVEPYSSSMRGSRCAFG